VPWSELVKKCARLMRRIEYLPVCYEVDEFPEERLFQEWCIKFSRVNKSADAR